MAQRSHTVHRFPSNPHHVKFSSSPHNVTTLSQIFCAPQQMQSWPQAQVYASRFPVSHAPVPQPSPPQMGTHTPAPEAQPAPYPVPYPVWAKKDQLTTAAPVQGGIGMDLLKKMGWNPGEGLGKNKEGSLVPLMLQVKTDKKGLYANNEAPKPTMEESAQDLAGKHPVSALMELCSRRRWGAPDYQLLDENGPDHRKSYLIKVSVQGVDYQPSLSSNSKKQARARAATVCLQAIGVLPSESEKIL